LDLEFTKMHGLGNDFIVVDDRDVLFDFAPEAVAWLCDRHFGIGADGLILVRPPQTDGSDFFMQYYNADGSVAEMCGNGVRCFAKFVADRRLIDGDALRVDTLGGTKAIAIARDGLGLMEVATVDMGEPVLDPALIPTTFTSEACSGDLVATEVGTFEITCVSMGNPHAVVWVRDVDDVPVEEIGPAIETNEAFPAKTNVEFAHVESPDRIRLRVWERGVGETLACGTGACATLVAASLTARFGREGIVELPGGELYVRWAEDGHVYMTGPAAEVFSGRVWLGPEEPDQA
jgi:diaminopimelate epimerase